MRQFRENFFPIRTKMLSTPINYFADLKASQAILEIDLKHPPCLLTL